jgi:hypothetical protein
MMYGFDVGHQGHQGHLGHLGYLGCLRHGYHGSMFTFVYMVTFIALATIVAFAKMDMMFTLTETTNGTQPPGWGINPLR